MLYSKQWSVLKPYRRNEKEKPRLSNEAEGNRKRKVFLTHCSKSLKELVKFIKGLSFMLLPLLLEILNFEQKFYSSKRLWGYSLKKWSYLSAFSNEKNEWARPFFVCMHKSCLLPDEQLNRQYRCPASYLLARISAAPASAALTKATARASCEPVLFPALKLLHVSPRANNEGETAKPRRMKMKSAENYCSIKPTG